MSRRVAVLLLFVLPLLGAAVGRMAAPFFARAHHTVRLAARVWLEEREGVAERTEESEAFRLTGRANEELFAEARGIARQFQVGSTVLGAFLGVVFGLKLCGFAAARRERIYTIDHSECVSCGRCFLTCPREHVRLRKLGKEPEA
jgi:NAD-dependent dihydropyrimidine dehydrogenase PreA subunit